MTLQDILYVVQIAQMGNFSKAAESLYVTESTISQKIKKLENELHMPLFVRSTRKVELTPEGVVFVQKAAPILSAYDALVDSMRQISRESQKTLSVGMTTKLYAARLPNFFRAFCLSHPELDVKLQATSYMELRSLLLKSELDYAVLKMHTVMRQYFDPHTFKHVLLRVETLYVLLANHLIPAGKKELRLCDVAHLPVILDDVGTSMYGIIEQIYQEAGLELQLSTMHTGDEETILLSVEHGDGITFATQSIVDYYQGRYQFAALPLVPTVTNSIYLVYRKEMKPTSYDREFFRSLREWLSTTES